MFDDHFEIFLADTKEGREIHHNIRYQVYCEELGYEDTTRFPDQQEFDKWDSQDDGDQQSVPFLVRLKHSNQWIAAMRVVHHRNQELPLQEFTTLDHTIHNSSIEVSRLCIVKEIRKPYIQNAYGIDETNTSNYQLATKKSDDNVSLFYSNPKIKNTIIWGLFNASMQYSAENNVKKCYLLASKALARVLGRQGFDIEKVGETFEHRGKRSPYRFDVQEILTNPIWNSFVQGYRVYSELSTFSESNLAVA